MSAARTWIADYYDAMEHYAWAPDELDHRSIRNGAETVKRKSPYDTVKRLQTLEVPFNHLLSFVFSLAPPRLAGELFKEKVGVQFDGEVNFLGRAIDKDPDVGSVTQPDFAFDGDHAFLTIETKIGSQSSIEQLQKYAFLHAIRRRNRPSRAHGHLFITPYGEQRLFPKGVRTLGDARTQAAKNLREGEQTKLTLQKAPLDGPSREAARVLLARKPLLLDRRRDDAVDEQDRRRVVVPPGAPFGEVVAHGLVVAVDAEDLHRSLSIGAGCRVYVNQLESACRARRASIPRRVRSPGEKPRVSRADFRANAAEFRSRSR